MIKAGPDLVFETDTPEQMALELLAHGVSVVYEGIPLFARQDKFGDLSARIEFPDYAYPPADGKALIMWRDLNPEAYLEWKAGQAAAQAIRRRILRAAYGADRSPAAFCFQSDVTGALIRDAMENGDTLDALDFGACLYGDDAEAVGQLAIREAQRQAGLRQGAR